MTEETQNNYEALTTEVMDVISGSYQKLLSIENILSRVSEFIKMLPEKSVDAFINGGKINNNGIAQLAQSIHRSIHSYQKGGDYPDTEHKKALYNFKLLDKSKFIDEFITLGKEIGEWLDEYKANGTLKYSNNLRPSQLITALNTVIYEGQNEAIKKRIIGLTVGMIGSMANSRLSSKDGLPATLVVSIYEAAVLLAEKEGLKNYSDLQLVEEGKRMGNQAANEVAKYTFDNSTLFSQGKTVDLEAVRDTIVTKAREEVKPSSLSLTSLFSAVNFASIFMVSNVSKLWQSSLIFVSDLAQSINWLVKYSGHKNSKTQITITTPLAMPPQSIKEEGIQPKVEEVLNAVESHDPQRVVTLTSSTSLQGNMNNKSGVVVEAFYPQPIISNTNGNPKPPQQK